MTDVAEAKRSPTLQEKIVQGGYEGYSYSYPHKTSYRTFEAPKALAPLWEKENKDELFLYIHLPFCEFRCGFCNLLTTVNPADSLVDAYLKSLKTQSRVVQDCVQSNKVTQVAFGGGTPSYLNAHELSEMFDFLETDWSFSSADTPVAFEVSPGTVDDDRLSVLSERGVQRISMGVQTFVQNELKQLGRPQKSDEVASACERIRSSTIPVFNLDLIYGTVGQTEQSWRESLKQAVAWEPEEIYLYPLYVRELTGLGNRGDSPSAKRLRLYELGRDYLLSSGYEQQSMRYFRKPESAMIDSEWSCQEDGMVGLGAGARSYTQSVHYSSEYAVGKKGVRQIIENYCQQTEEQYSSAHYGVCLNSEEQRRRYVIKSILRTAGLNVKRYQSRFRSMPVDDFPQLKALEQLAMADITQKNIRLNRLGMAHSDTIGPWLYSASVTEQMNDYELT